MMPQVARVRVHSGQDRVRLWIPLLPIYLVLLPVFVLVALLLLVACLVYRVNPIRAFGASAHLLWALGGFQVQVKQGDTDVLVKLT